MAGKGWLKFTPKANSLAKASAPRVATFTLELCKFCIIKQNMAKLPLNCSQMPPIRFRMALDALPALPLPEAVLASISTPQQDCVGQGLGSHWLAASEHRCGCTLLPMEPASLARDQKENFKRRLYSKTQSIKGAERISGQHLRFSLQILSTDILLIWRQICAKSNQPLHENHRSDCFCEKYLHQNHCLRQWQCCELECLI